MREGALKSALFAGLHRTGLLALAETARRGITVLAYHGVTARSADAPRGRNRRRLHVPAERFAEHLRVLTRHAAPVSLPALLEHLETGRALPPRAALVTFDDGYANFATQAWPLLQAAGVPATLFVVTDDGTPFWQDRLEAALEASACASVVWQGQTWPLASDSDRERGHCAWMRALAALEVDEREAALATLITRLGGPGDLADDDRRRLSWDELRALQARGLDVGAHADRHEALTRGPAGEVRERLSSSRARLAHALGVTDLVLAYPYGAWSADVVAGARSAGFRAAFSTAPRLVTRGQDLHRLGRFLIGADDDPTRLRITLAGFRALWQRDGGAA